MTSCAPTIIITTFNRRSPVASTPQHWPNSPTVVSKQSSFGSTHFDRTKLANQVTKATDAPTTISGTAYVVNTLMLVVSFEEMLQFSRKLCLDAEIILDEKVFQSEMTHSARNR
ncbi:hypothetical protein NE599_20500, partial [[Clostridium] symbiosum]|nr:hypothetical protein [[Clostridium] symbiosum]